MHFCLLDAFFSLYIWCFFSSCFGFSRRKLRGSDRREHEYWKQFYSIFNNAFSVVFLSSLFLSLFVFVSISSWNRFLYFCLFFHSSSHSHYTSVYFFFPSIAINGVFVRDGFCGILFPQWIHFPLFSVSIVWCSRIFLACLLCVHVETWLSISWVGFLCLGCESAFGNKLLKVICPSWELAWMLKLIIFCWKCPTQTTHGIQLLCIYISLLLILLLPFRAMATIFW